MTVKGKLFAGLGAILVMVILMGGVGIWNTVRSSESISALGLTNNQEAVQLATIQRALWQMHYALAQFMALTDRAAREKIIANESKWHKEIDDSLDNFKRGSHSADELADMKKFETQYKQYKDARPRWFQLYGEGKIDEANEWHAKSISPLGESTVTVLSDLVREQQEAAELHEKKGEGAG